MPVERKQARLKLWRGQTYLYFTDYTCVPPKEVRISRVEGKVIGRLDKAARRKLVLDYRRKEKIETGESVKRSGPVGYHTLLVDALDRFIERCQERADLRAANPGDRKHGLSPKTHAMLTATVGRFKAWLKKEKKAKLEAGDLDKNTIERYVVHYSGTKGKQGGHRDVHRSPATVAMEVRNLRSCLRWLDTERPRLFPDFAAISPALKADNGNAVKALALEPEKLTAFVATALEREGETFTYNVKRIIRKGAKRGRVENFKQRPAEKAATPVSRLLLLLALTGCRLGEALALKWEHVDLKRGRITIYAQKTGQWRILPLIGAPEGDVAPRFVELLKHWRMQAGDREYVLPHHNISEPLFAKSAWQLANRAAGLGRIGPQMLRRNFTSYAASMGIPPAVAAMWQGHGANIAEKHYRQQLLKREQGSTIEDHMGLRPIIDQMIPAIPAKKFSDATA